MYKWKTSFHRSELQDGFVKNIFEILNKGTRYTDLDGKFVGYINALEGPLGIIHFISDHSLEYGRYPFVTIRVRYVDKSVLYFRIDDERLSLYEFKNGHWANSISRYFRKEDKDENKGN